MQFPVARFVACVIALPLLYFFMETRIRYRNPNLLLVKWGSRPDVYGAYKKLFPRSMAIRLYLGAGAGTIVFFLLACYMQYRQGK